MKSILLIGSLLLSSLTFAGEKGNGGGVHLCPSLGTVEMYDLYEGYARYDVARTQKVLSVDEYLAQALEKLRGVSPRFEKLVRNKIQYLKSGHIIFRKGIRLTLSDDANILMTDEGCSYEQMANWDNLSEGIIVKKEYFDRLQDLDKAALYLHEAIYKVARDLFDVKNSDLTRKLVGLTLSDEKLNSLPWKLEDVVINKIQSIEGPAPEVLTNMGFKFSYNLGNKNFWDENVSIKVKITFPRAPEMLLLTQQTISTLKSSIQYHRGIGERDRRDGNYQNYEIMNGIANNHEQSLKIYEAALTELMVFVPTELTIIPDETTFSQLNVSNTFIDSTKTYARPVELAAGFELTLEVTSKSGLLLQETVQGSLIDIEYRSQILGIFFQQNGF